MGFLTTRARESGFLSAIATWVFAAGVLSAQPQLLLPASEYEVKAAFLYNCAKFVEWPNDPSERQNTPISVCILGKDPFGPAIEEAVRGKTAGGGNSHAAATREQIVGLLVEVGQLGGRSPEMVAQVRDGVLRVMEKLGMIEKSLPAVKQPARHWTWVAEVESTQEGLWYPEFEIGDEVQTDLARTSRKPARLQPEKER